MTWPTFTRAILALLALWGTAIAGPPAADAIEGIVVDATTGAPIAGATVTVHKGGARPGHMSGYMGGPIATTSTGADGRFRAQVLEREDMVTVSAMAPGHAHARVYVQPPDDKETRPAPLRIALAPAWTLTGRVTAPDGTPVEGASVFALSVRGPDDLRRMPEATSMGQDSDGVVRTWTTLKATSGSDGRFLIEGLVLGEAHAVMAKLPGLLPTAWSKPTLPTSGGTAVVDLRFLAAASIFVTVRGPDGRPMPNAWIVIGSRSSEGTLADALGVARVRNLPPGKHRLSVTATDHLRHREDIELAEGELDKPVVVALSRGHTLEGVLVDDREKPLPGIFVQVIGTAEESETEDPLSSSNGKTDAQGRFHVRALRDGEHELSLHVEDHEPVKLKLTVPSSTVRVIARRLSSAHGRLVVAPGTSFPEEIDASYEVADRNARGWCEALVEGPALRLKNVAGGQTRLVIYAKGFAPVVKDLPIPPGEDVDVGEIRLHVGKTLAGRVTDRLGKPIPGAQVSTWSSDVASRQYVTTDADGSFSLKHLGEGMFEIEVSAEGFATGRIEAVAAGTAPTILMSRGGLLRGVLSASADVLERGSFEVHVFSPTPLDGQLRDESLKPAADGSFEVRLPAGTYVVELRTATPGGRVLAKQTGVAIKEGEGASIRLEVPR